MSVAILITGYLRSFSVSLWPFLNSLPNSFHVFLYVPQSHSSDKFLNDTSDLNRISSYKRVKAILVDSDEPSFNEGLTQREKNSIIQWYRLQKLFQLIPHTYETVVRCRPDVKFLCDTESFLAYFKTTCPKQTVLIPLGFDIFDSKYVSEKDLMACVNDQIAIGTYEVMKQYCDHYTCIQNQVSPIISELSLFYYFKMKQIQIQRIDLPYNLLLSECFTFSICGDSGSGKSYLSRLIQQILPFDQTLLFETDRYHKWERGAEEYKTYTHLHPEANHLEKLSTDAYKLRLGEDVYIVDYDHTTGRFTEPQCVKSNNYVIFCGLHTLYKESLRAIMDLRIYMDTDPDVKLEWKVQRDTVERGASLEKVLSTIQARGPDFQQYVAPQKNNANLVFRFYRNGLEIQIRKELCDAHLQKKLAQFCIQQESTDDWICFEVCKDVTGKAITEAAQQEGYFLRHLNDSFDGVIQYLIVLLTWKPTS
jgi:uridine kinase